MTSQPAENDFLHQFGKKSESEKNTESHHGFDNGICLTRELEKSEKVIGKMVLKHILSFENMGISWLLTN